MKRILPFYLILFFFVSCNQNNLKTDEKKLSEQIKIEEQEKQKSKVDSNNGISDSISTGFRFREDRSVDPKNPPQIIDIAGSIGKSENISLSDVASQIKYVRMETVPDSTLLRNLEYKYYLMDNYIVAINLYGIHLFTKEGNFLRTVVKNDLSGIAYNEKMNAIFVRDDHTKVGGGTSVWAIGNNLFYEYSNTMTGENYIMKYDCLQNQTLVNSGFDPENPDKLNGLGEVFIDISNRKVVKQNGHGMWSADPASFYGEMKLFTLNKDTYIKRLQGNDMMGVFNSRGDTLSTFTKMERVENYTKSVARGTDYGIEYEINGNLFYRTDFNDTVFQVIPPNRLLPRYVLNLGSYKISMLEGMDPGVSLEGKIIPMEWAETEDFIFLTFSKDSYDCPNTRKDKSLKIYHALYSKESKQLQIVNADPTDYSAPILENDIDGGLAIWPRSYMVGKNGEILVSLKGKELKSHILSSQFKSSTAPGSKKNELLEFANLVNKEDNILMIVE